MNDLYINVKIIDDISVLEGDGNYTHQYIYHRIYGILLARICQIRLTFSR